MTYKQLLEIESRLHEIIQHTVDSIHDAVQNEPIRGVKKISTNPSCLTVRLSDLNSTWSAESYSSDSQAKLVKDALTSASSARSFKSKLDALIEDRSVLKAGCRHRLNDTTIKVLTDVRAKLFEEDVPLF